MKKLLLTLAFLAGFALPSAHAARVPLTYIHTSTWTVGGSGTKAWAFQNTSSGISVRIHKLEMGSATGATVTGGIQQFWVYGSTSLTHGDTSQVSFYDTAGANATAPSYVSVSTRPTVVVYEGKNDRQLPIFRPLIINADESAAANFYDALVPSSPAEAEEFLLPEGANRALVIEQKQFGATDYVAGVVFVRVVWSPY